MISWATRRSVNWNAAQNTFVQKVLRRARRGERVIFIPGNHDEVLRNYLGIALGDIEIIGEYTHTLADGRRFLLPATMRLQAGSGQQGIQLYVYVIGFSHLVTCVCQEWMGWRC